MNIHFTEEAIKTVHQKLDHDPIMLKLVYDTDGCGCAVSGIAALWVVKEKQAHEVDAESNAFRIIYNRNQEVFFEDELTIDVNATTGTFTLKSKSQIYNNRMTLKTISG